MNTLNTDPLAHVLARGAGVDNGVVLSQGEIIEYFQETDGHALKILGEQTKDQINKIIDQAASLRKESVATVRQLVEGLLSLSNTPSSPQTQTVLF